MSSTLLILAAVVGGWAVQPTSPTSSPWRSTARSCCAPGTVSVGPGGATAAGVRTSRSPWTTTASCGTRSRCAASRLRPPAPAPPLFDLKVNAVRGERDIPQLSRQQREAARQAALLFKQGRDTLASV